MMKKKLFFGMMGAIALTFTACTSEDNLAEVNPNYNAETGTVNADFVINVATDNGSTRMTAANTQADLDQTFRGINNAELLVYKLGTSNDGKYVTTATTASKKFSLGTAMTAGFLTGNTETGGQTSSRRVFELALPTESNALLFYGKAIKDDTDAKEGKIDWNVSEVISENSFKLCPILSDATEKAKFEETENLLAAYLNVLCETGITNETLSFGGQSTTVASLKWSDFANITTSSITAKTTAPLDQSGSTPMCALGEILADEFVNFNTVYDGEIRAGSGPSVRRMLADLYVVVNKLASTSETTPTSLAEVVAQEVAQKLRDKIAAVLNNPTTSPEWNTNAAIASAADFALTNLTGSDHITDFPVPYGLPYGAAQITTTLSAGKVTWKYVRDDLPMSGMGGTTTSVYNYMYPAELCYFGNSPVRVTNESHANADYPNGVANWDDDAKWQAGANTGTTISWTKNGHVLSTTRSVAMQENINYGTALLKTTVRYGAANLNDNNAAIQQARTGATEANNVINVSDATSDFTLTGIVIGGQEQEMGWNYIAKSTSPSFASMIYDKDIPDTSIPAYTSSGAKSAPVYTLVWDNWNVNLKGKKQNPVYIALEFVNNTGKDFWGNKNIVRNGGTFYIIGKLDPNANFTFADTSNPTAAELAAGITWPIYDATESNYRPYALPPYDTSTGKTLQERRVFIQDYLTEANFVIGENSLQSAYVTVPDLRSTQLSLGLSVDLKWQTGLKFDNVVLGQ